MPGRRPPALRKPLPRAIALRLADIRRHYEALALALERTSRESFARAVRLDDAEALTGVVYPVERGFEIVSNYVAELAELGLREAGLSPGSRPANLRLLERERVISAAQYRRLRGALEARNELQHEYPDVFAAATYEAAGALVDEVPRFLRAYVAWLRRLGFGPPPGE